MRATITVPLLAAALCAIRAASAQNAQVAEPAEVTLVGLEISKPLPGEAAKKFRGAAPVGTALKLLVGVEGKRLIKLDEQGSKILAFVDDIGTDLTKRPAERSWTRSRFGFPRISDDGQNCLLEASGTSVPAAGAKQIHLKAQLLFMCGGEEETAAQKDVALKAGSPITAGPVAWTIKSTKPGGASGGWGRKDKITLVLTAKASAEELAKIKEVTFLDSGGKEIDSSRTESSWIGWGKTRSVTWAYGLAREAATVTVRVAYYTSIETVSIPVDVKTGVGL